MHPCRVFLLAEVTESVVMQLAGFEVFQAEDVEEAAGVSLHQPLVISMVAGTGDFRLARPCRFEPLPAPVLACACLRVSLRA